jgi:hypothetical protein
MDARHSLGSIYGEMIRSSDLGGVILTEHRYHNRLHVPGHWHDYSISYLILESKPGGSRV